MSFHLILNNKEKMCIMQQNLYCRAPSQCFSCLLYLVCLQYGTNTKNVCMFQMFLNEIALAVVVVVLFRYFSWNIIFQCGHKLRDDHHLVCGIKVHVTDFTYFTRQISLKPTTGQKVFVLVQEVGISYEFQLSIGFNSNKENLTV